MKAFVSLAVFFLLVLSSFDGSAQDSTTSVFLLDTLPAKGIELNKGWKFHAGDDTVWKESHFDDRPL